MSFKSAPGHFIHTITVILATQCLFSEIAEAAKINSFFKGVVSEIESPVGYTLENLIEGPIAAANSKDALAIFEEVPKEKRDGNSNAFAKRVACFFLGQTDKKYKLSFCTDELILGPEDGGIRGDPFKKAELSNRVLTVLNEGGSNWGWSYQIEIRYQHNDFYIVGFTEESCAPNLHCYKLVQNLNTGDSELIETKRDEKPSLKKTKNSALKPKLVKKFRYDALPALPKQNDW